MQEVLGRKFPVADVSIAIVWIDMLETDSGEEAKVSSRILQDPRVVQFHDPKQRAGKAIAASLGAEGQVAWDIYLFYGRDSEWETGPPAPSGWLHQLDASWADPARRFYDRGLVDKLDEIVSQLVE